VRCNLRETLTPSVLGSAEWRFIDEKNYCPLSAGVHYHRLLLRFALVKRDVYVLAVATFLSFEARESIRALAETYSMVASCLFDPSVSIPSNAAGLVTSHSLQSCRSFLFGKTMGGGKYNLLLRLIKGSSPSCRPHFTRRGSAAKPQ
jgi:hypothetical protein